MTTTQLYRQFDKDRQLLYVGISYDAQTRLRAHKNSSEWFNSIKTIDIETFSSREKAVTAEIQAIANEHPKFNMNGADHLDTFDPTTRDELIAALQALSAEAPQPLQREVNMAIHKITYPMRDILAKVPGDSVTERAKKLGVSRQTMYVWASEKFRPTRVQAKRVSKVTGVPIEHILDDGFEVNNDAGRKARKKTARVATARKKTAKRDRNTAPKRRSASPSRKIARDA